MTRKQIGRNTGNSGRINVSGSELEKLGLDIGDDVEVDVVDAKEVAHALIDSKDSEEFPHRYPSLRHANGTHLPYEPRPVLELLP